MEVVLELVHPRFPDLDAFLHLILLVGLSFLSRRLTPLRRGREFSGCR